MVLCCVLQQFVPKRGGEDDRDGYGEPPPKQQPKGPGEGLTKFSVEIVQQLEFTTSANNSQISTNVTVKALNTSVKSDLSTSTASPAPPPQQQQQPQQPPHVVKQEQEDPEFVDLEQCAAALEKDAAANGGHSFPGFSDLIGDETSDAIMASEAFKDLFSEISDFHPGFLKDFDFDGGDSKHHESQQHQHHVFKTEDDSKSNAQQQQQQQQRVNVQQQQQQQQQRMYSSSMDFSKAELSPAAQTLKQMAEQHQHKSQLGMSFTPGNPYPELINSPPQQNIKQEVNSPVYSPSPRLQYSPYGSPGHAHGSPQFTPRPPGQPPQQPPPQRPPSHPGAATLQINQAQQLHISQAQGQPPIQVSVAVPPSDNHAMYKG